MGVSLLLPIILSVKAIQMNNVQSSLLNKDMLFDENWANMEELKEEIITQWDELVKKTHTQQAIWWLNGFWGTLEEDKERIWDMVHIMIEIECGEQKRYGKLKWEEKEGSALNPSESHRFLKRMNEKTLTAKHLDVDKNKMLALSEYLAGKYEKGIEEIVEAPQGGEAAVEALNKAKAAVSHATSALNKAVDEEANAKTALDQKKESSKASNEARIAVNKAVAEVERLEKDRSDNITKLKHKSYNKDLPMMEQQKAQRELKKAQEEDTPNLLKAKLTQKSALKKSKKAEKAAAKEEKKSKSDVEVAAKAREEALKSVQEAEDIFTDLKKNGDGIAHGEIWWMEKELSERTKFMPKGRK